VTGVPLEAFYTDGPDVISFRTGHVGPSPVPPFILGTTKPDDDNTGPRTAMTTTITPADLTGGSITKIYSTPTAVTNTRFEVWVDIRGANVTFTDCEFVGPTTWTTGRPLVQATNSAVSGARFDFCLFQPTTPGQAVDGLFGHDWITSRCRFRHCLDSWGAVHLTAPGGPLTNVRDEGSFSNDHCYRSPDPLQSDGHTHNDGSQLHYEPKKVAFVGSRIEGLIDTTVSTYSAPTFSGSVQTGGYRWFGQNDAAGGVAKWTTSGILSSKGTNMVVLDDVLWQSCWLDGGQFGPINLGTWTTGSNIRVLGCRIGRRSQYGKAIICKSTLPVTGTGNTFEDDGTSADFPLTGAGGARMNG
jgi:hypothetical protein